MEVQTWNIQTRSEGLLESGIIGKHIYANLYEPDLNVISNEELLREVVIRAAKTANMSLIEVRSWKVEGSKGGVSVLALITESHIAIHTWVNYRFATLDIYTCGEKSDPWKAFEYVLSILRPKTFKVHYADRSSMR